MAEYKLVGTRDIHDSTIVSVEERGSQLVVYLKSIDKKPFEIVFKDVSDVVSYKAEGMLLYSLISDISENPPHRFKFINWYDEADSSSESVKLLEVVAKECQVFNTREQ